MLEEPTKGKGKSKSAKGKGKPEPEEPKSKGKNKSAVREHVASLQAFAVLYSLLRCHFAQKKYYKPSFYYQLTILFLVRSFSQQPAVDIKGSAKALSKLEGSQPVVGFISQLN